MVVKRQGEYLQDMILTELANGLKDVEIQKKLEIPQTSYFRFKRALAEKIAYYQSKITDNDIALANEVYEQRILKLFSVALAKAEDKESGKNPEFITTAAQLATNLLIMKKNGLIEATTKRHDLKKQKQQLLLLQQGQTVNQVF